MATALGRIFGRVAQNVVLILVAGDLIHAAPQVVGIVDHEPAGAVRQHVERAVVKIRAPHWRKDGVGIREQVPVGHGWVGWRSAAASPAGGASPTDSTAAPRAGRTCSTCASAARTARATAGGAARGSAGRAPGASAPAAGGTTRGATRSEEHTSELQ